MRKLIFGGTIVNEGREFKGSIVIDGDRINKIIEGNEAPRGTYDETIDATGCFVLPGIIDEHVHFREPGMTDKATIESESRAAAYGGVTTYFEMPNTNPQTTTLEALDDKFSRAAADSHVNYSFFFGATNSNTALFDSLDSHRIPGIKLFMGASTGNMLVDRAEALSSIFSTCARLGLPLMTHCEDTTIINDNMRQAREKYGDDPAIALHPVIRSEEACWRSSSLAAKMAKEYGTRLHIAHVTTARELSLAEPQPTVVGPKEPLITLEAVIAHLYFSDEDYSTKGALIKCNPAVKSADDRDALRRALTDGRITTVGTDHAPHLLSQKQGGCRKAASGMPMVQFSLPTMLELVDDGVLTIRRLVELMAHNPARIFSVSGRGFLREGYKADIVVVRRGNPWTVTENIIQSKCKWSPMQGHNYRWRVQQTICNGHIIYNKGDFDEAYRGEAVIFRS
ncbi:dihydroorotase [uncultured Prevotella sp.]|uniref:dihydroorotase n=1 Tax=uncultured Prevotella sp. TaxID=159272 RepID=UPI002590EB5F|nr:dihydroorotase [uncultured Prevotella sp.]